MLDFMIRNCPGIGILKHDFCACLSLKSRLDYVCVMSTSCRLITTNVCLL